MKVNRLETHDRLLHYKSDDFDIGKTVQNIIDSRPFGEHPFYIFAHARTLGLDEKMERFNKDTYLSIADTTYKKKYKTLADVEEKRLIWQPRLTKPKAETNSWLFKAYPGKDLVKVIWMLPEEAMWPQYEKGKMTESDTVLYSIEMYKNQRQKLEAKEEDDLDDDTCRSIYRQIKGQIKQNRKIKLKSEEVFSTSILELD